MLRLLANLRWVVFLSIQTNGESMFYWNYNNEEKIYGILRLVSPWFGPCSGCVEEKHEEGAHQATLYAAMQDILRRLETEAEISFYSICDHRVTPLQRWKLDWRWPWSAIKHPNAGVTPWVGKLVLTGTMLAIKACLGSCRNLLGLDKVKTVHGCSQNGSVNSTSQINLFNIRHQEKSILSWWWLQSFKA